MSTSESRYGPYCNTIQYPCYNKLICCTIWPYYCNTLLQYIVCCNTCTTLYNTYCNRMLLEYCRFSSSTKSRKYCNMAIPVLKYEIHMKYVLLLQYVYLLEYTCTYSSTHTRVLQYRYRYFGWVIAIAIAIWPY